MIDKHPVTCFLKLHHFGILLVSFENCREMRVHVGQSLTVVVRTFSLLEIHMQYFHVNIKKPFPMAKSTFKDMPCSNMWKLFLHVMMEK